MSEASVMAGPDLHEALVGRTLGADGKYRLLRIIARGGMGAVFEGEQTNLPRRVAIKVADPVMAQQPSFAARFRREVGAVARLEHGPHILPVYDVGEEDGLLYLVMPLVLGGTLRDRLQRDGGRPWLPREALPLVQQVLAALAYAHRRGVIHRDVKPSNILLEDDRVYLADFGIAKALQESVDDALIGGTLTGTALVGTPAYMAPEQALGLAVDARADLYACGVVLYELLTGRVPYQAQTPMQVAFKHVEAALPPPRLLNPNLPEAVEAVLTCALARQPEARYPTAEAFAAAFAQAVEEAEQPNEQAPDKQVPAQSPASPQPGQRQSETGTPLNPPQTPPVAQSLPDPPPFEAELLRRLQRVMAERAVRAGHLPKEQRTPTEAGKRPASPTPAPQTPAPARRAVEQPRQNASEPRQLPSSTSQAAVSPPPAHPLSADKRPAERQPSKPNGEEAGAPARSSKVQSNQPAGGARVPSRERWSRHAPVSALGPVAVLAALAALLLFTAPLWRPIPQGTTTPAPQPTVRPPTPAPSGPIPPMAVKRGGHTATLLADGRVLVAGGQEGDSTYLATAQVYDPAANRWSTVASLATARSGHTATLLPNGQVLVVGGQSGDTTYPAQAERYDPATNRWSPAGILSQGRVGHTATLLPNGQVLVVGGQNSNRFIDTAERYDPATNSWSPAGIMSTVRSGHAAALLPNGRVLIAGGSAASTILSSAELYDATANRWTPAAAMAQERVGHTAIVLPGGEVLVAGGYNTSHEDGSFGAKLLNQAERYNPAANRWTPAGTLFQGRVGHTMTLLPGGQVLIAGGQLDPTAYLATTERYNPATNRWSTTAKLRDRRSGHTATLLADGRVLVAGGQDGPDWLASVEWYDSQANTWISG